MLNLIYQKRNTDFESLSQILAEFGILIFDSINCHYTAICAVSFIPLTALPLFFLIKYTKNEQICGRKPFFVTNTDITSKFSSIRGPPISFLLTFTKDKKEKILCQKIFLNYFLKVRKFCGV